jgi:hypothetical protein
MLVLHLLALSALDTVKIM